MGCQPPAGSTAQSLPGGYIPRVEKERECWKFLDRRLTVENDSRVHGQPSLAVEVYSPVRNHSLPPVGGEGQPHVFPGLTARRLTRPNGRPRCVSCDSHCVSCPHLGRWPASSCERTETRNTVSESQRCPENKSKNKRTDGKVLRNNSLVGHLCLCFLPWFQGHVGRAPALSSKG